MTIAGRLRGRLHADSEPLDDVVLGGVAGLRCSSRSSCTGRQRVPV